MSNPFQPAFEPVEPTVSLTKGGALSPTSAIPAASLVPAAAAAARPLPAPGWYQEPDKPGVLRYWNGASWEEWRKPLVEAPTIDQGQKSMAIAYLLLIFVGSTGAHRFYLGRIGSAVTMLVLWLVGLATSVLLIGIPLLMAVGIWTLVDLFLVPGMIRTAALRSIQPMR